MVKYKCGKCGKEFSLEDVIRTWGRRLQCPHCGYPIIYKVARNYRLVKAI